ncbi:thiamine diphosphokinase [Fusibacter bizertensis]
MKWGLISLNGNFTSIAKLNNQLERYVGLKNLKVVLGVDGGCELISKLNIKATEILGDFDSIINLDQYRLLWPNAKVHTYPPEKDFTDAELAFNIIKEHDLDKIVVIGGLGGRADHMLSILFLLAREDKFIIIDEQNYIEKIDTPYLKKVSIKDYGNDYISLVPLESGLKGIYLNGFKYPLVDAHIKFAETLGISNELIGDEGSISIDGGKGYLVISNDLLHKSVE